MAIYYLRLQTISRNQGRSTVGAAAYRSGERLYSEYDGLTHDYTKRGMVGAAAYRSGDRLHDGNGVQDFTKKRGIAYTEVMLPDNAPPEFLDRQTLWNAVERVEKRRDARLAREVVIALPNELSIDEHIKLVREYVNGSFVSQGMCADIAIHSGHQHRKDDQHIEAEHDNIIRPQNPHAHILLADRPVGERGFEAKKNRAWNDHQNVELWREQWAKAQNRELERKKLDVRVNHESYERQGLDREAYHHLGHQAAALERRGIRTQQGDENRAIRVRNRARGYRGMEEKETQPSGFKHDVLTAKTRQEQEIRQHIPRENRDGGHNIQELWQQWLGNTGRIGQELDPDKYKPSDGGGRTLQEQMLNWLNELGREGQDKDRSR